MDPCLLLPLDQALVFILHHGSSHIVVQLLLLEVEILFSLGQLPPKRVDHDFLLLHHG